MWRRKKLGLVPHEDGGCAKKLCGNICLKLWQRACVEVLDGSVTADRVFTNLGSYLCVEEHGLVKEHTSPEHDCGLQGKHEMEA